MTLGELVTAIEQLTAAIEQVYKTRSWNSPVPTLDPYVQEARDLLSKARKLKIQISRTGDLTRQAAAVKSLAGQLESMLGPAVDPDEIEEEDSWLYRCPKHGAVIVTESQLQARGTDEGFCPVCEREPQDPR